MDPLSVTCGVVTLIAATTKTYKTLSDLYNLRNAPQESRELLQEVSWLKKLLCLVEENTSSIPSSSITSESQNIMKESIGSAREPLLELDRLIATSTRNIGKNRGEAGILPKVSTVKWLASQKDIEKLRNKFHRAHKNLDTALLALLTLGFGQRQDITLSIDMSELMSKLLHAIEAQTDVQKNQTDILTSQIKLLSRSEHVISKPAKDALVSSELRSVSHQASSEKARFQITDPGSDPDFGSKTWLTLGKEEETLYNFKGSQNIIKPSSSVRASVSKSKCDWNCWCQCHSVEKGESPRWLKECLGLLFYSYTGTPFLRSRSCNSSACSRRESASYQFTYHFPRWLMKRAFFLSTYHRDLGGVAVTWSIGFPRTISASHKAWQYIEKNQPDGFLWLLRKKMITGNDMADDDGVSLLIYALKFRSHQIVEFLLDHGAHPHQVDPRGISACAYAESSLLIDRPAQRPSWVAQMDLPEDECSFTDDISFTPLHPIVLGWEEADLHQRIRLSRYNINSQDSFGRSLLHWAVIMGNSDAIEVLLNNGALPTCFDKEKMTPLHDIFLAPPSSQAQCARFLLDAGAEVDALDFWGRSAFRIAIGYANVSLDLLALLIKKGANVNCTDIYCQSPLLKSIQGCKEATKLVLDHNADVDAPDGYGNTPVLEAIYRNKPEQLQILLERGAKTGGYFKLQPGRLARDGRLHLLDFVAWYGSVEIMRVLEKSARQKYHLSQPLDTLDQHQDFRSANGRNTRPKEREAFNRMRMELCYEGYSYSSFSEVESDDEDRFFDTEDNLC